MHRPCCTTLQKFTDSLYAITTYGVAVQTPPPNKKKTKALKVNQSFLAKARKEADKLKVKVLNDATCKDPVLRRA